MKWIDKDSWDLETKMSKFKILNLPKWNKELKRWEYSVERIEDE